MEISRIRRDLLLTSALVAALAGSLAPAAAATAAGVAPVPTHTSMKNRTPTEQVQEVLDSAEIPGSSVTVVTSSSTGRAVTTDGQPTGTAVRVGSVSKGVAGAVADALVQDGRATFDEPVGTYLPNLAEPYRTFTLKQLLTHTTGLPHDVTVTDVDRPDATAASIIGDLPANPDLGTGYRYSSLNYILVQAVVEARSGTPYGEAITHYLVADTLHADCARPVQQGRVPFFMGDLAAPEVCDGAGFGYGYLAGDQSQLAQWAQWNLSSAGQAFHARSQQASVEVRDGQRYGFGWNYGTSEVAGAERATISHPGAVPGSYTLVKLVPSLDTAVVVTIPSYGELRAEETTGLADRAVAAALGEPVEPENTGMSTGMAVLAVVLMVVLASLVALALQVRRIVRGRPRNGWRVAVAVGAAVAAWGGVVLGVPMSTGVDIATLATWAPDLALLAVVLVAAATLAVVLSGVQRGRRSA